MKRFTRREKYRRHILAIARRNAKQRARWKELVLQKRKAVIGASLETAIRVASPRGVTARVPKRFTIREYPDAVASFLIFVEEQLKKGRAIFVEMKDVVEMDYGAIASLLAVMHKFRVAKLMVNGTYPNDQVLADRLRESGFIWHLFENKLESKVKYNIGAENQLITQETDMADRQLINQVVRDASETIWGAQRRCPGLVRVIGELMDNTRDHANRSNGVQRWWLSVNHDKESKKVRFVFLDYGVGIFGSLSSQPDDHPVIVFLKGIQSEVGIHATDKYLEALMTKKIRKTSTKKKGRGYGLFGIGGTVARNQISNLYVVSNMAAGDVSSGSYVRLSSEFRGTLFSWELCYNNQNLEP